MSAFANFALSWARAHCVGVNSGAVKAGIVSARMVAAGSMGRSPHKKGFGKGCASIARTIRSRCGAALGRSRGERSVEFGHFGALLLEVRLMRKSVAEAGSEVW